MASSPFQVNAGRFLLAEVFKVVYLGGDEVTPDKQLGTIKIRNHRYHHYIYNVDNADTSKSSMKHGDQLTLTGPTLAPISCPSGFLVIEVDLFCGAFKRSVRIDWAPVPGDECKYLERRIKSKDGCGEILISLGMFFYAMEAFLEVRLLTKDSSAASVGGLVAAHTSNSVNPAHIIKPCSEQNARLKPKSLGMSNTIESVGALNDRCVYSDEESDEDFLSEDDED